MSKEPDNREELEAKQAALVIDIENRMRAFGTVPALDDMDFTSWQLLEGEGQVWKERRDAYDIISILEAAYRALQDASAEIALQGYNSYGYDPSQLRLLPESVLVLFRQQKYNWAYNGEKPSTVTLQHVLGAADRAFYLNYQRNRTRSTRYTRQSVHDLFEIRNLIDSATEIEESFDYQPTDFQDIVAISDFVQVITNPKIIEQRKRRVDEGQS